MGNKIYLHHTLDEYKKKYGGKNLKTIRKEETVKDQNLLKDRSWWLIDNVYYEVPEKQSWWSNIGKGGRIAICVLSGIALTTAIVVPTVLAINKNKTQILDVELSDGITGVSIESKKKLENGSLEITLKPDDGKEIVSINKVVVGNQELKINVDYVLNGNVITINKDIIDAHKNEKIIITPVIEDIVKKEMTVTCSDREIEIEDTIKEYVLVAKDSSGNEIGDVNYTCDSSDIIINGNKFKVATNAIGGSAVIKSHKNGFISASWEIEIGSFSKCRFENGEVSAKDIYISGIVVIPSKYFDSVSNKWITVNSIPDFTDPPAWSGFASCGSVTSVTIPDTITSFGKRSFSACGMEEIKISKTSKLKTIGSSCFNYCTALKSFYFPKELENNNFNGTMFSKCSNVLFDTSDSLYFSSSDDKIVLYNNEKTKLYCAPGLTDETYQILNTVNTICESAFSDNEYLKKLIIPSSVVVIEKNILHECSNLTDVEFYDPHNWRAGSTQLKSEDLTNVQTAKQYLCETYNKYVWIKVKTEIINCEWNEGQWDYESGKVDLDKGIHACKVVFGSNSLSSCGFYVKLYEEKYNVELDPSFIVVYLNNNDVSSYAHYDEERLLFKFDNDLISQFKQNDELNVFFKMPKSVNNVYCFIG